MADQFEGSIWEAAGRGEDDANYAQVRLEKNTYQLRCIDIIKGQVWTSSVSVTSNLSSQFKQLGYVVSSITQEKFEMLWNLYKKSDKK